MLPIISYLESQLNRSMSRMDTLKACVRRKITWRWNLDLLCLLVSHTREKKKVFLIVINFVRETCCDDPRNLQNHRNGILNFKDIADHWIGFPKSPYTTSYAVTAQPTTSSTAPPTSAPLSVNKYSKQKKTKSKKSSSKRRYDDYDLPTYKDGFRDKDYEDDFDYDYSAFGPVVRNPYAPSPYVIKTTATAPKSVYANPAVGSSSQAMKAIYAGIPKVATYVVPNTKKYVVERVKSEAVYVPPASSDVYAAASSHGMRRVDPMDYDDGGGGSSFLNLGPQEGFPPRPVMNKITQPGQRQPCHGPDCHQHHKGLVRFYWRRVVYPPNERGRGRGRGRLRRPTRGRRRRLRGSARAPSDQRDVYYTDDDNSDDADDDNDPQENVNNGNVDEDEEDEDNQEEDTKYRNVWQPGRGYGHDLNEGSNYDDREMKTYRDKRYAYKKRMRRRYPKHLSQ